MASPFLRNAEERAHLDRVEDLENNRAVYFDYLSLFMVCYLLIKDQLYVFPSVFSCILSLEVLALFHLNHLHFLVFVSFFSGFMEFYKVQVMMLI